MSVLQVFKFPHPVLTQEAKPVARFDSELKQLADNMLETMYAEGGIGLAANQVGQLKRLIVMDLRNEDQEELARPRPDRRREPRIFVNPRLLEASGETVTEDFIDHQVSVNDVWCYAATCVVSSAEKQTDDWDAVESMVESSRNRRASSQMTASCTNPRKKRTTGVPMTNDLCSTSSKPKPSRNGCTILFSWVTAVT